MRKNETRILHGDVRAVLGDLPDGSVHCCVTSPPYYGLRDYGTAQWEGGDAACDHAPQVAARSTRPRSGLTGGLATVDAGTVRPGDCPCGARRIDQQIGLEPSPDEYAAALVSVFREVRRVLRTDGTLWLNIGDSYAGHNLPGWRPGNETKNQGSSNKNGVGYIEGCKPKDLIGIPWLLAFALRSDGWYLRQDIIWHKLNPMPESVTDRCTKAHEYLFLLSKSEHYYYDAEEIEEPTGNKRSVWRVVADPYPGAHFACFPPLLIEPCIKAGCPPGGVVLDPFFGAGTTGLVAGILHRDCIGIELNHDYCLMAQKRINKKGGFFFQAKIE